LWLLALLGWSWRIGAPHFDAQFKSLTGKLFDISGAVWVAVTGRAADLAE